jgi:putative DNA primase/helicase
METYPIPSDLRTRRQWIVWRYEPRPGKSKPAKVPYTPATNLRASTKTPATWGTYAQAVAAFQLGGYDGLGYVFAQDDPFCGIDLDNCRHPETGEIAPWAQALITRMKSYTEVTPSGAGFHILVRAALPHHVGKKRGSIEVYDHQRFFTVTGCHLTGTPATIEARQAEVVALYALLASEEEENTGWGGRRLVLPTRSSGITLDDEAVLAKAMSARNGATFQQLWMGDTSGCQSQSEADYRLCLLLAYWTNLNAAQMDRLFRRSGLMRAKWDQQISGRGHTYGEVTIYNTLNPGRSRPHEPLHPRRPFRSVTHTEPRQRLSETPADRQVLLAQVGAQLQARARAHLEKGATDLLVLLAPPGVGKSHQVAELGLPSQMDLAWVAERHSMVESVQSLKQYREIEACRTSNCPDWEIHRLVGERGYNTRAIHRQHASPCAYVEQFTTPGSKVYQLAHVRTSYPARHQGLVVDEMDLSKWLPERELGIAPLHAATVASTPGSEAEQLLLAVQATLTDAERAQTPLHGQALFAALNQRCQGQLAAWVSRLHNAPGTLMDPRPWVDLDTSAPDAVEQAERLPPVVLPHLVAALFRELPQWEQGQPWNSLLRLGPGRHGWSVFLTEPLTFTPDEAGHHPPRLVLDATADPELLQLLHGMVKIERAEVQAPPGMRHIAVRTGKRYGKRSLCIRRKDGSQPDLLRALAECRYLLHREDPEGTLAASGQIGLISFKTCVDQMGEALGIPKERRLWFWGARGSNALEGCRLLLVVGTPTLRPGETARLARALWRHDPVPIDETAIRDAETGAWRYVDARLQRLAEYLSRAELTQCAHRSRPLRYTGEEARTVITLCQGTIDFLPVSETITALPFLTADGKDRAIVRRAAEQEHLARAYADLCQAVNCITVEALRQAAHVRKATASAWLKGRRQAELQESRQETPTSALSASSPNPTDAFHSNTGPAFAALPSRMAPPDESEVQALVADLAADWRVASHPWLICGACGGHLWRRMPCGEEVCCSCNPAPLWSDRLVARIRACASGTSGPAARMVSAAPQCGGGPRAARSCP